MTDWRFSHYENKSDEAWCIRPAKMVNVVTGEWFLSRCESTRASRCKYCSEIHRGDVASVGRSGWLDKPTERGYWCALTAPGVEVLPWDRSKCSHSPSVTCSGSERGCVVEETALAIWHDDLGLRWSHFMHDLRRLVNPSVTGAVSSWPVQVEFHKSYEPQARGALHIHFMMRLEGVITDRRFKAAFKLASSRHGFGKQLHFEQIDLSNAEQVARKAGYLAKYSTKCADLLPDVRRLNPCTGELRDGGLRSWSASRHWGDSMTDVKQRRCKWAENDGRSEAGKGAPAPDCADGDGVALDSYQDHYALIAQEYEDFLVATGQKLV